MKKLLLVTSDGVLADTVRDKIDCEIVVSDKVDSGNYDLIALTDEVSISDDEFIQNNNIIRLHNSLLPSFNTSESVKDAYVSGVKVTGVTVHRVENADMTGLILAQYPVLIDSYTSYGQLETEIKQTGYKLYPLVIKSVVNDTVFDLVEFLSATPKHKCHGCGKCSGK